ncbi:MAG: sigma-54 dependent transcriptional regulator, partial [Bacteroidota bacterium]
VQKVADTDLTVLIQGESGTGKELVARALHSSGGRRGGPFIAVNCSALPESLFESELFGHEKGSFTGATQMRRGKFEEANRGTIFLDEIGDIPPGIQAKLLRVLQEKTFERVGSNKAQTADTRVVAATNRDLEAMAVQGDFREDLFYRVNVFPILLPPLRERLEDIPLLVEQMLERHADLTGGRVRHVSPKVLSAMMMHQWRGNVRELENLVTRAMVTTTGDTIERVDLPADESAAAESSGETAGPSQDLPFREYLDTILRHAEERYLLRMLDLCKGNINQVSRKMGVDRKTIYRKLAEYSIDPARFRPS